MTLKQPLPENILAKDLDHILARTKNLWPELKRRRLFITGGTGFFGSWFLESFAQANRRYGLKASALVLTRDAAAFKKKLPRLAADPAIKFHRGDVRTFSFPGGKFSHIIHAAATSATATFRKIDPRETFDIIVGGTKRTLDFAAACRAEKFLLTSSGTVYGKPPAGLKRLTEDYRGAPDPLNPASFLGESKRAAETLGALYGEKFGLAVKVARCFSFIGPHLPLAVHYAAGNFIRDGLKGGPIKVIGDGTASRSYLYAADLMIWLWTILFKGRAGRAYNVGSEKETTIAELAETVARGFPGGLAVKIARRPIAGAAPERYLPSVARAKKELGLKESVSLKEAIKRTIIFNSKSYDRPK